MIKILIADDHAVVRSGLSMLLSAKPQFKVVGEAAEGGEAIQKAEELKPDVILMDLSMPHGKEGLSATSEIKNKLPDIAILILYPTATKRLMEEYLEQLKKGENIDSYQLLSDRERDTFMGCQRVLQ